MLWLFVAVHGLSLVAETGGYSLFVVRDLIVVASFFEELQGKQTQQWQCIGSAVAMHTLSSCNAWAQLWRTGLVAARNVETSWTRDWTCVPCTGRWILNHWPPGKSSISFDSCLEFPSLYLYHLLVFKNCPVFSLNALSILIIIILNSWSIIPKSLSSINVVLMDDLSLQAVFCLSACPLMCTRKSDMIY